MILQLLFAAMPILEPAFNATQVEKGAPKIEWTKNVDGSESTVLTAKAAGIDLDGVRFSRSSESSNDFFVVTYVLENPTKELRYASVGWRTVFRVADGNDRNWFPTTECVLDLSIQNSLWGYYTKPGTWHFSLVEPWFAAYNPDMQSGFAFLFDYNTLSAAYGANDLQTRGVVFDGGFLRPGDRFVVTTKILEIKGLPSLATVNDYFAAGFSGPAVAPELTVYPFADIFIEGAARQVDVTGKVLGEAVVTANLKRGQPRAVAVVRSEKPTAQTVLSARLNGISFDQFRENGFRMASLPMVPPVWPVHRKMPPKVLPGCATVRNHAEDKALLLFGFYANFFRFEEMYPELKFTVVPAVPDGIVNPPPASTMGGYKYVFMGDVNEESVRPMLARIAAYVRNGGTLVVAGGPFAYGCGGYEGTFMETLLPVKTHSFDCLPACASDRDGRTAVKFSESDCSLFWMQMDEVKPGAEVLVSCGGKPLLVKWSYGNGRVFAFLAAPLGDEARDGAVFWKNPRYLDLMKDKLK